MSDAKQILQRLTEVLQARKQADPEQSYVARLYAKGLPAITAKINEEAGELVEAAGEPPDALIHEMADLWFHCLVLLAYQDRDVSEVLEELQRRFGISGLDEKANRPE